MPRGTNRKHVEEILRLAAPRAIGPTEVIVRLRDAKGIQMPFTSVRHALDQLVSAGVAEEDGDTKTWRYTGEATLNLRSVK